MTHHKYRIFQAFGR